MVEWQSLKEVDPKIFEAIKGELKRENEGLELIPSENYVSKAVLVAMGSVLTNKYSEGYPGKRYYGGQKYTDIVETLAIERAKKLFGAEHANVQPLSGAPANTAVYFALLKPKDVVLGMDLTHGGHLTHGHPVTTMAQLYKFSRYKMDKKTGQIDLDEVRKLALKKKPKLILVGYSAYPRDIDYKGFREIADEVDAYLMADIAHIAGMIATDLMNDPVPYSDVITTTTHKTLRGPRGGMILCKIEDRLHSIHNPDSKLNLAQLIDKAVFPGFQGGPHEHQIAAKAVAFKEDLRPEFKEYCKQILKNAKVLAEELLGYGFDLVTGGTDNHLLLIDVTNKGLTGKEAQDALDKAAITTNKNVVPDDPRKPFDPSGIRLGTPAVTTRGFKEEEMKQVAEWINRVIEKPNDSSVKEKVKGEILELCRRFPLYNLYECI